MRTFITVAALVALTAAKNGELADLIKGIGSFEGKRSDCAADKAPGALAYLKREASKEVAYRLKDGSFCREMVACWGDHYFMVSSGQSIECDSACQKAWSKLMVVNNTLSNVRCLVPQRALAKNVAVDRNSKWRRVYGSDEFVRLEAPGSGMPCVKGKCVGESQCELTKAAIPMCTTDGEPILQSVGETLEAVVKRVSERDSDTCMEGAKPAPEAKTNDFSYSDDGSDDDREGSQDVFATGDWTTVYSSTVTDMTVPSRHMANKKRFSRGQHPADLLPTNLFELSTNELMQIAARMKDTLE